MQRTAETRRNILQVTRDLIMAGNLDPTANEIAQRAGITTRTLFRHFTDMQALHRSFIEDTQASAARVMDEPFPANADTHWQQQMLTVIQRRTRVYESLLPLYISTIWSRYRATAPEAIHQVSIKRRRSRLTDILPTHMVADVPLFEALDGILSIEFWISLRRDQKLSVSRATLVLRTAVEKLTA